MTRVGDRAWFVATWPADTTTESPHVKLAKHFSREQYKVCDSEAYFKY